MEKGVEHAAEERTVNLLDDFCSCFACIPARRDGRQLELVEVVVGGVLVGRSDDEGDEVEGEVEGTEDGGEEEAVVVYAAVDEGDGSLEVVEEGVDVCGGSVDAGDAQNQGNAPARRTLTSTPALRKSAILASGTK